MRNVIYATLALSALLAGQASAATYNQGTTVFPANPPVSTSSTFGNDGISFYYISGSAGSFCRLDQTGTNSGNSGNNVTISSLNNPNYGVENGTNSDSTIAINQLQDGNDHAAPWSATISMPNSICNTGYTVSVSAKNGGLTNATAAPAGFTSTLPYTIGVSFAGTNKGPVLASAALTLTPLVTSPTAYVGPLTITMSGAASNAYLLYGAYADVVTLDLAPAI